MWDMLSLLPAALLAAPAGLNPTLPLLFVSILARYTERIELLGPYAFLGQTWCVFLLGALFLLHVFSDKAFAPGDSWAVPPERRDRRLWLGAVHDLSHMLLGPLSGALLFGAIERFFPAALFLVGPMIGALLAALVYVGKRRLRRRLAARWAPFGNLLLSLLEDTGVLVLCLAAAFLVAP
ncbi:MAG: DUF4126 domain-containing protein, partial [Chloroflexia bacterium]|nr:DUF4126 domain-containing protein [Chloroflexia bacterium]